jgi:uncharacterized integral membrane protein
MRTVYALLVGLVTLAVVIFQVQNLSSVTVFFLQMNATLPLGLVVLGAYLLGMSTGGFMAALVRQWIARLKTERSGSGS